MRYFTLAAAFLGASSYLAAADPLLLNLLMPDARMASGVNVAKAKTSPFGQFVLRQVPENSDFAKFIKDSGFDPRKDLQEIVMASTGNTGRLVAARGSFDAAKIVALAIADGKHKSAAYNGAQLITSTDAASNQAFALFDSNFALAGT